MARTRATTGRLGGLMLLAAALAGCAPLAADMAPVVYRAPEGQPALPVRQTFAGSEREAVLGAADGLSRLGLETDKAEADQGLLVATYVGDPERYVDCGSLAVDGAQDWRPAAAGSLRLHPFAKQPTWVALRQMRLDARVLARTRAGDSASQINVTATYVVTRTVDTINTAGAVLGTARETIGFESGGVGRFGNGTICLPRGVLEREAADVMVAAAGVAPTQTAGSETAATRAIGTSELAGPAAAPASNAPVALTQASEPPAPAADALDTFVASMPCSEATVVRVSDRRLRVTGYLADEAERARLLAGIRERAAGAAVKDELVLLPPGSCEALRFVDATGTRALPGFDIAFSGAEPPLADGTEVTLVVTLPQADRYFYVGYIQADGTINHLGPKYIDSRGIGERFLYRTGYKVARPNGTEMLVAIASREPLFQTDRPPSEPASAFFAELRDSFGASPANVAAIKLVLETRTP